MSYPLTAILSDLHGNLPALEVALEDARQREARRFVCLGDVVGYGARPRECLDAVMRLCAPDPDGSAGFGELEPGFCLLGNHEHALLYSAEDFNPRARAAIEWTRDALNRSDGRYAYWDWIAGLRPTHFDGTAMYAHGSPRDPVREYMLPVDARDPDKLRANFACMDASVCFVGHSHFPALYYEDGGFLRPEGSAGADGAIDLGDPAGRVPVIVNVGSVGQPRDGDPRLCYALFDGRRVTFVRLAYDMERAQADIRAVPELPTQLADRLAVGR